MCHMTSVSLSLVMLHIYLETSKYISISYHFLNIEMAQVIEILALHSQYNGWLLITWGWKEPGH